MWCHIKFANIAPKEYSNIINASDENKLSFVCSHCHLDSLPFPDRFSQEDEENVHLNNDPIVIYT
jgi:hypothetical protein